MFRIIGKLFPWLVEREPTIEEKLWYGVDDYFPVAGNVKFRIVYNQESDVKSIVNNEYSLPATSRDAMSPVLAEFLERLNGEEKELVLKDLPDSKLLKAEARKNNGNSERLEEGEKKGKKDEKEEESVYSVPCSSGLTLQSTAADSQSSYIMGRVVSGPINKQHYLSLSIPPEVYKKHEIEALVSYIKDQKLEISPKESFSLAPVRFFRNGMIALYKIEVIVECYTIIPQIVHDVFDDYGSVLDFSYVSYTNEFLIDSPTVCVYVLIHIIERYDGSLPYIGARRGLSAPVHLLKKVPIRQW